MASECQICGGNGFIKDEHGQYSTCNECIPPDICNVPSEPSSRTHILDSANELINGDRAQTHGDAKTTFAKIGAYWSVYVGKKIDSQDVANMMVLLKVCRAQENPANIDNFIDQAGYAALGWEVSK